MAERPTDVVIIGGGGREDALLWKLRQSPLVGQIYVGPGNGGTERFADTKRIHIDPTNAIEILDAARDLHSGLVVVVGPEKPLIAGVADILRSKGLAVFGPNKEAAKLESSKIAAVEFMKRHGIPHPGSFAFDSQYKATNFLADGRMDTGAWSLLNWGMVIKVDGPAEGKGVIVLDYRHTDEWSWALERIFQIREFGDSGNRILIQSLAKGFEVSATVVVSGKDYLILPYSEDHKQQKDGDIGPNTGGMGVLAPHAVLTSEMEKQIEEKIIKPTVYGLVKEGIYFQGVLYPGIMITKDGPEVLEYNVRFGDPETEAIMPLLESDIFPILESAADPTKEFKNTLNKKTGSSVVVSLTSGGYPGTYEKGKPIHGLNGNYEGVTIYHAATSKTNDEFVTSGGRVVMVAGFGENADKAREKAYAAIGENGVHFEGMHYRKDIGNRKRNV